MTQPAPDEEREPNDGPATATPWLPGAPTMQGRLAPRGDEDWFAFTATAAPAGAHFGGPMPASVKIVDAERRVVPPGTPLVAGKTLLRGHQGGQRQGLEPARAVHRDPGAIMAISR